MRNLLAFVLAAGCYNPDITSGGFACNSTLADTECPDGYSCQVGACVNPLGMDVKGRGADGCCVKVTGTPSELPMVMIPKTGAPYSGAHTDPGLNTPADCPDSDLEPNDGPDPNGQPLKLPPLVADMAPPKIVKLSICPDGNSPVTGRHDVDFFKLDNSGGPSLTLMAEVFYDIGMGDLDIGIYTYDGHQLNSLSVDGTAVTNGCTAAAIQSGIYYVVVAGANNVDVNRYELLVRTFSAPMSCPSSP